MVSFVPKQEHENYNDHVAKHLLHCLSSVLTKIPYILILPPHSYCIDFIQTGALTAVKKTADHAYLHYGCLEILWVRILTWLEHRRSRETNGRLLLRQGLTGKWSLPIDMLSCSKYGGNAYMQPSMHFPISF